ncbi:hypothetical protein BDF21DRAFT_406589 [Thamnidium elegans]|nr:hypothetical protein BDF21DRAFT_406589 [Thamnidium elegans]
MNVQVNNLHSFASIDIPDQPIDYYISKIRKNPTKLEYLEEVRVLIIDRISEVDVDVFKKVDYICRKIRLNEKPFGGIQVILCGDSDLLRPGPHKDAFESEICNEVINESFVLNSTF